MDHVSHFVTTDDGRRLHVVSSPHGVVPLVASNSIGTDLSLFDRQADAFANHSVWRYDTRGHGRSDVPVGDYSIDRLGRDLLAVIDATGADRADLCGVSIGGVTALWVAINAQHRVRRLVLANTAARIGDATLWDERIRMVRATGLAPLTEPSMTRWFTSDFRAASPVFVKHFADVLTGMSADGYAGCCAALRDTDLRDATRQVSCPTLVVAGRQDMATTPALGRWVADTIAGARFVELDAAHLSNVERADEFNRITSAFLSEDGNG